LSDPVESKLRIGVIRESLFGFPKYVRPAAGELDMIASASASLMSFERVADDDAAVLANQVSESVSAFIVADLLAHDARAVTHHIGHGFSSWPSSFGQPV